MTVFAYINDHPHISQVEGESDPSAGSTFSDVT